LTVEKTAPKGKASKDPNKPKRPTSAFFVFMEGFRKQFKKNPTISSVAVLLSGQHAVGPSSVEGVTRELSRVRSKDVENSFDGDKDGGDENAGNEKDGRNMNDDGGKTMDTTTMVEIFKVMTRLVNLLYCVTGEIMSVMLDVCEMHLILKCDAVGSQLYVHMLDAVGVLK
ncbi:HMG1/2-like protein, partial [Tanacetum coccineum]